MNLRKHFLEAATLIVAAILCALVSNALASRDRKMVTVGSYPNALKVPAAAPETPQTAVPAGSAAEAAPVTASDTPTSATATSATTTSAAVSLPPSSVNTQTAAATTSGGGGKSTAVTTAAPAQPRQAATAQLATQAATQAAAQPATPSSGASAPRHAAALPATPAPPPAATPKGDLSRYAPHPDKQYIEIAYADVAALHAAGALFLDARRTNIYEQGHIPGARSFSVWESDVGDKVRALWEQRQDPKEQALPIVIYCSGGDCEDSHMLSEKLWGAQFSNLYVYKDGFPDWQFHHGPVHTGGTP